MNTTHDIAPHHWQEWLDSCVDPEIISLNVRSVADLDVDPFTHEVTTPIADLLNWRYTRFGQQVKQSLRGWWVSGLDPLNGWKPMDWGRFKPDSDTPVMDREKGKPAKYLSPKGAKSRVTFLAVDRESWQRISDRTGVAIREADTEFWPWVQANVKVDLTPTEGEKKAGCLLSIGYAAIALPGITGAVRTKDEHGQQCPAHLIPELEPFAQPGRKWTICFDFEAKPKTLTAVELEIEKLKNQLIRRGCEARIVDLPGPEKGVDDFVAAHGADAYHRLYENALTFERWQVRRLCKLTYPPNLLLNQKYLGKLAIPADAKFICIRSPKGTGKTESFVEMAAEATRNGRRVLIITHRVQLGQAICDRIGLPYVSELRTAEEGRLLGYGVCIDSLHPESQARFNADDWEDALIIMDECEQVIWHLLAAATEVSNRRMPILSQLKQLLINALESDRGQIVFSDADLSNLSVEFAQGLVEQRIQPWVVQNTWKPEDAWHITHYADKSPDKCLAAMFQEIESGGRVFCTTQSQRKKGKYSSQTLEALILRKFPDKRVLRIDSQSVSDPTHPAYLCTSRLNEILLQYDVVIATPVIETGVSIDIEGHFDSVWAFFNGVAPENSARQALARVREPVPRHIWIAKYGLGKVANGSTSVRAILRAEHEISHIASKLIQVFNFDEDLVASYSSALRTWAKMAARINAGNVNYRESVLNGLIEEGHIVVEAEPAANPTQIIEELQAVRDEHYSAECEAIASAEEITPQQYDELRGKKAKTEADWHKERKHSIKQRYQIDVTPELVAKDDQGWYPQLRLQYFLTFGRQFLQERDRQSLEQTAQTGGAWLPALNRSQLSTRISMLEGLGIKRLLDPDAEFNGGTKKLEYANAHPELLRLAEMAKRFSTKIKDHLGVTISKAMSPIQVAQTILGKIGMKLKCDRQQGSTGCRERVYRFVAPKDGREEILQGWFTRDEATRNQSEMHTPGINNSITRQVGGAA